MITKQQYESALQRIEELLPFVGNEVQMSDRNMIEMDIVTDTVNSYEKIHYPIEMTEEADPFAELAGKH